MSDALTVARSTWRVRTRAWISLGLLAGLGAGAVMAAATGARRTDSAYTRFHRAYAGADAVVEPNYGDAFADIGIDDIRKLPEVATAGHYVGAETLGGITIA